MIPHATHPPFPALNKIITSHVGEEYIDLQPTSPVFEKVFDDGLTEQGYQDYPHIPKMFVLNDSDATELMHGGFGDLSGYVNRDGSMWESDAWPGWWGMMMGTKGRNEIEVMDGTTFYFADDPAIQSWDCWAMGHYFHFLGELVLGSYHAYASAMFDPSVLPVGREPFKNGSVPFWSTPIIDRQDEGAVRARLLPSPSRIVIPFCGAWEPHVLQNLVVKEAMRQPGG